MNRFIELLIYPVMSSGDPLDKLLTCLQRGRANATNPLPFSVAVAVTFCGRQALLPAVEEKSNVLADFRGDYVRQPARVSFEEVPERGAKDRCHKSRRFAGYRGNPQGERIEGSLIRNLSWKINFERGDVYGVIKLCFYIILPSVLEIAG